VRGYFVVVLVKDVIEMVLNRYDMRVWMEINWLRIKTDGYVW